MLQRITICAKSSVLCHKVVSCVINFITLWNRNVFPGVDHRLERTKRVFN